MRETVITTHDGPRRALYITYDGLSDPLGRSQVLPYLIGLARRDHIIHVLSCEKPDKVERERGTVEALCRDAGISWHPLVYHKRPPVLSTAYDLAMLRRAAVRLHRLHDFGLTHCRSYIPAAVGLHLKRAHGVPLLFDMRGFWPEEKTEGKSWNLANPLFRLVYHYFKRLERRLLEESDAIVSLTEAGKRELLRRPETAVRAEQITVIPCCVDFAHFALAVGDSRETTRKYLGIAPSERVLAYLGSLGSWYMLGEMLDFFDAYRARNASARFLFVTPEDPRLIFAEASKRGVSHDQLIILPATREEVPGLMAAADLGIFFIKPVFSKTASSPTKMGEMLALGLPIVTNAGVGDVAEILQRSKTGVAIEEFSATSYERALDQVALSTMSAEERRTSAQVCFDVERGIARYDRIYRQLLTERPAASNASSKRASNASRE